MPGQGAIAYFWGDNPSFNSLTGKGFSAAGQFGVGGSTESYYPPYACSNCGGIVLDPSLSESFVNKGGDDRFTAIVFSVDGKQYLSSAMSFVINAGAVTVPTSIDGGMVYSTSAPFAFTGWLEGQPWSAADGLLGGATRRVNLMGTGTVRLGFGENHWFSSMYSFQGTPAPVPEPATLLLVATGALGLARRARRWTS